MTSDLLRALIAVDGEPDDADSFNLLRPVSEAQHALRLAMIAQDLADIEQRARELEAERARCVRPQW